MGTRTGVICGLLALTAVGAPALAQDAYVSASVAADITRFSRSTAEGVTDFSGSGEAIGFALRAGTPIGASWGAEAEFARPSEIQREGDPDFITLTSLPGLEATTLPGLFESFPLGFSQKTSHRTMTFSTSAWVRQTFTSRVSLVYLGGLTFARTNFRHELSLVPRLLPFAPGVQPTILPPGSQSVIEFVQYGVHPLVGVEARVALTEHIELVPSMRLMGLDTGWLARPAVGIGWVF